MEPVYVLEAVADAFEAAGRTLRERVALMRAEGAGESAVAGPRDVVARARALHPSLGPRQAQVVREVEEAGSEGAAAGMISRTLDYDQPNVYLTLQGLCNSGLVEKDESVRPHRYRLGPKLRQEPTN